MNPYYIEIAMFIILIIIMAYLTSISASYSDIDLDVLESENSQKRKFKKLKKLLKNKYKFINKLNLSITFCELCISAISVEVFATPVYRKYVEEVNMPPLTFKYILILGTTFLVTYLLLVLGTLLPKHVGHKLSKKIAFSTINVVYILSFIFSPFGVILHKTDEFFIDVFEKKSKDRQKFSDTEVKNIVEKIEEDGLITIEDKTFIENIINLDKMPVSSIMKDIDKLKSLDVDLSREEIMKRVKEYDHSYFPVYYKNTNNMLGIVSVKKIFAEKDAERFRLEEMVTKILVVSQRKTINILLKKMMKDNMKFAIVQDEKNNNIGYITYTDILTSYMQNNIKEEN